MQTLGVSSPEDREDNFFQRLFWPSVHNQYDVDLVGRRGFWLAFAVGVLSAVVTLVQGSPLVALLILLVFTLGAAGIRQRSLAASTLVFTAYTIGVLSQWMTAAVRSAHIGNPVVSLVGMALLLSCIRATLLSRRFAAAGDHEFPDDRPNGFAHTLADTFPRIAWPKGKFVFYTCAGLYLVLLVLGSIVIASHPNTMPTQQEQTSTGS